MRIEGQPIPLAIDNHAIIGSASAGGLAHPASLCAVASSQFELEFYQEQSGRQPVLEWLRHELAPDDRRTLGAAMWAILQQQGVGVCGTSFGRQLGGGLFEFRLREPPLNARVFCHAYGDRIVLLLGGYDKGRDPSQRRQEREISIARERLREWQRRQT